MAVSSATVRIMRARVALEADHRVVVFGVANLPETRIAGEDRPVATGLDETVDGVAHPPRPVLVVTGSHKQTATRQERGITIEVGIDGVVQLDALRLRPYCEPTLPIEPTRRCRPQRIVVRRLIPLDAQVLRVVVPDIGDSPVVAVVVGDASDIATFDRTQK